LKKDSSSESDRDLEDSAIAAGSPAAWWASSRRPFVAKTTGGFLLVRQSATEAEKPPLRQPRVVGQPKVERCPDRTGNRYLLERSFIRRVYEEIVMSEEPGLLSSLPDSPVDRSVVEAISDADGIRSTISPTWQTPIQGDGEYTEDLIIITDTHVRYLSRERGDGWFIKRSETYGDDEEFEEVMDDVHEYACDYSEERIEKKVREDRSA
jgi:hypothetical protein